MPHVHRRRTSVFKFLSDRPVILTSVILTSKCRVVGEEATTTYFNVLGLTRPARDGLELKTYRMRLNFFFQTSYFLGSGIVTLLNPVHDTGAPSMTKYGLKAGFNLLTCSGKVKI
jgi:hypothetical protein